MALTATSNMDEIQMNSAVKSQSIGLMERDGKEFAGLHVIVDIYGAEKLDDPDYVETVLRKCIDQCQATLLNMTLHTFPPTNGVTGVACLSESHISVHTWPEHKYAAFDIFMCGNSEPEIAADIIIKDFGASSYTIQKIQRGEPIEMNKNKILGAKHDVQIINSHS
jgi:S-adenosylmethionine decarboxylase